MGKPTGFLEYDRTEITYRPVEERKQDWKEVDLIGSNDELAIQGARCMDCGIPFCQSPAGCPLGNIIPDFNDLVYKGDWEEAMHRLHATNNFPEVTGRVCPAPCEQACTLNINIDPVSIKQIERAIADNAIREEWLTPEPPRQQTGKRIAVVGSGPAGLAAAQQLGRAGHAVVVFERQDRIGGLLRYGIPDFKMEKDLIDRRMVQMQGEGVEFRVNQHIGVNVPATELVDGYDAVVLACGAEKPRDLPIPGRELDGIHFAMDFLPQQNKRVAGDDMPGPDDDGAIHAKGKKVVVIGGGDTGSDCIGTSHRQGAVSVTNLELLPMPPEDRDDSSPWPWWPYKLFLSSSHNEGGEREYSVLTKRFLDDGNGNVRALEAIHVVWSDPDEHGRRQMQEVEGSEFEIECDLVLLAMGFVHPVHEGLVEQLKLALTDRGNVATDLDYRTSMDKVFCTGDMTRGQSLVVRAIADGRRTAYAVDGFLMGRSELPRGPKRDLPDMLAALEP